MTKQATKYGQRATLLGVAFALCAAAPLARPGPTWPGPMNPVAGLSVTN